MQDPENGPEASSGQRLMSEGELKEKALKLQRTFLGSMFPILGVEWYRFFLMASAFFLCAFSYTYLRLYKDVVIHTSLETSAQNWLKCFTFAASVFTVSIVQRLLANSDIDTVFGFLTLVFAAFLTAIGFLLKFREYVQLKDGWTQEFFVLNSADVRGLSSLYILFLIFNHWVLSFFYVVCEVIGSIMVSYLPMTYFNAHCTPEQNGRFVRVLYIFSNFAGALAGAVYYMWNKSMRTKPVESRDKYYLIFAIIVALLFVIVFFIKTRLDKEFKNLIVEPSTITYKKKPKVKKPSMLDGLAHAFTSRLLLAMCAMTVFYNVSQVFQSSLNGNAYSASAKILGVEKSTFAGKYKSCETLATAIITVVVLISPCSRLCELFGAGLSGSFPIALCFFGILFSTLIALVNYPASGQPNYIFNGLFRDAERWPRLECVIDVCSSTAIKVSKYAFFDIVKEAISMKISPDERALFKGIYDGVCGKFGKCVGAIYGILMDEFIVHNRDSRYYSLITFCVIAVFSFLWIIALRYLSTKFAKVHNTNAYLSADYFETFKTVDKEQ